MVQHQVDNPLHLVRRTLSAMSPRIFCHGPWVADPSRGHLALHVCRHPWVANPACRACLLQTSPSQQAGRELGYEPKAKCCEMQRGLRNSYGTFVELVTCSLFFVDVMVCSLICRRNGGLFVDFSSKWWFFRGLFVKMVFFFVDVRPVPK